MKTAIKELIITSVKAKDSVRVGKITDMLRFKYGLNYQDIFDLFNELTDINEADFEQLLYISETY